MTVLRVWFLREAVTNRVGRVVATVLVIAVIGFASVALVSDIAEIV